MNMRVLLVVFLFAICLSLCKGCKKCSPVSCQVSNWSGWSSCSVACGKGKQRRSRYACRHPKCGGTKCPTLSDEKTCIARHGCPCIVNSWSAWGKCNKLCAGGRQSRTRSVKDYGGNVCPNLSENRQCNTKPCDCVVSSWSGWSECNKECGRGSETRSRTVKASPTLGGKKCPVLAQTRPCETKKCKVHCMVSEWSEWGRCNRECDSGLRTRSRIITRASMYDGDDCPATKDSQVCNTRPCRNCKITAWTAWGTCSKTCNSGNQTRIRRVEQEAEPGGEECPKNLEETQYCNTEGCPCEVSQWGAWQNCDKPCGWGKQIRTRKVTAPPTAGGKDCPKLEDSVKCKIAECEIDCELGQWTDWDDCSATCGEGLTYRRRNITVQPQNGGIPCDVLIEGDNCKLIECPVHCKTGNWSEWSNCTSESGRTCGKAGKAIRSRTIITHNKHGGKECPVLEETHNCKIDPCPIDCQYSDWSEWANCSSSCGPGKTTRYRNIYRQPEHGGEACPHQNETAKCNLGACPVDCEVGDWSEWGACMTAEGKKCGSGARIIRERAITTEPQHGGHECPCVVEEENCELAPCADCEVEAWGSWEVCMNGCDACGARYRERKIISNPDEVKCPKLKEIEKCHSGSRGGAGAGAGAGAG